MTYQTDKIKKKDTQNLELNKKILSLKQKLTIFKEINKIDNYTVLKSNIHTKNEYNLLLDLEIKQLNLYISHSDTFLFENKFITVNQIKKSIEVYSFENGFPIYFTNGNFLWSNYIINNLIYA